MLRRRQLKRVKAAFRSFSGPDLLIDYAEWQQALGIKNDFLLKRIFDLVDTDGTEFIDFPEFLAFAEYLYSDDRRKRLEFIFRIYDIEDDGAIDRKEIRQILEASLTEQRVTLDEKVMKDLVKSFMRKADTNCNGKVSLGEFVDVMSAYPAIDGQFTAYAADLLNQSRELRPPSARAASWLRRLRRAWENHRRALFWGATYVVSNAYLFTAAMQQYADAGAGLALQIARGAGACLNLNVALVLLPMCKSLWTWMRHTPFERLFPLDRMIDVHRIIGHFIALFALVHIAGHLVRLRATTTPILDTLLFTLAGATGVAATVILLLMLRFGRSIKRRRHEAFVASHLLYSAFLAVLLFHAPMLWAWLAPALLLYFFDCVVRVLRKTRKINIVEL
ncbi:MAG TPA: EF-hand domain-containing protein, partial [Burkholderiales bacterium]